MPETIWLSRACQYSVTRPKVRESTVEPKIPMINRRLGLKWSERYPEGICISA